MKVKVFFISALFLTLCITSCADRSTEDNVFSTPGSARVNKSTRLKLDTVRTKSQNGAEISTKAQADQEYVDPDKIVRPR